MNGSYSNCTGGAAKYLDTLIFGQHHIYQHPTCRRVYDTHTPYDPEGILGSFMAILTVSRFLKNKYILGKLLIRYIYLEIVHISSVNRILIGLFNVDYACNIFILALLHVAVVQFINNLILFRYN